MKSKSGSEKSATDRDGRDSDRTGMERERSGSSDRNERSGADRDRAGSSTERDRSGSSRSESSTTTREGGRSRASVNISSSQRTTIRQTIVKSGGGQRVSRSSLGGVSISVGTSLPRGGVTVSRVPSSIVEIVPEYRDYSYFVTDDDVIVIVDPDTYEIVHVIES